MYVCLCTGTTNSRIEEVVADGARSTKQVAAVCEAGSVCGRCKHTIRAIIEAGKQERAPASAQGQR